MANIIQPRPGARLNLSHPMSRNLAAWWLFNEGAGSQVADISVSGNNGTLTNMDLSSVWVGSPQGGAVAFDGTNDHVNVGLMPEFSANAVSASVSFWFRTSSAAQHHFFGTLNVVNGEAVFRAVLNFDPFTGVNNLGKMQFMVRSNFFASTTFGIGENSGVVDGNWHHIVFAYNKPAQTQAIYIDGVSRTLTIPTQNATVSFVPWTRPLAIGATFESASPSSFFNGSIGNFMIFNRMLTAAEVQQLFYEPYINILRSSISRSFSPVSNAPRAMSTYRRRRVA